MLLFLLLYCLYGYVLLFFFFFKQKTAYEMRISDWSSDVCSSDLGRCEAFHAVHMVSTSVSSSLFCLKYLALRSGMSDRRLLSSDLDSFVPHAASVSSSPARQRPLVTD